MALVPQPDKSVFAFAFLVVIPSGASEPAVSRFFVSVVTNVIRQRKAKPSNSSSHVFWGGTSKERETAGSLAPLGMTTRKTKAPFCTVVVLE